MARKQEQGESFHRLSNLLMICGGFMLAGSWILYDKVQMTQTFLDLTSYVMWGSVGVILITLSLIIWLIGHKIIIGKTKALKEIPFEKFDKVFNFQEAEQHHSTLVYSVLSVGIALSLYFLQASIFNKCSENCVPNLLHLSYGYLVLFVSTLLIESFSQKMLRFRNHKVKELIAQLPYIRCEFLVEILILSPLFICYISFFSKNIFLFITSISLFIIVIVNWYRRPNNM